ncbi:hypothetical protein HK102_005125 [Quaeritorhiza haematococci]|nr:hypothetical protein HK102_005125 [Quaeritorhiza haematococci]
MVPEVNANSDFEGDSSGSETEVEDFEEQKPSSSGNTDAAVRSNAGLTFDTNLIKAETSAAEHMAKYFPDLTPSTDCVICIGRMRIFNAFD